MNDQVIFSRTNNPVKAAKNDSQKESGGLFGRAQELILKYQEIFNPQHQGGARIHVDEIASKVASFYERIRGIIDWKEEHLIRRTAIERTLKRRLIPELSGFSLMADLDPKKMAEPMVLELTRGGHFPNDQIPRARLANVAKILHKYIYLLQNNPLAKKGSSSGVKTKVNFFNWLLEIAACEIEEVLDPPLRQNALVEYMTDLISERIQVYPKETLKAGEKRLQAYIAVHRTLFHLDAPIISYRLLKYRYPSWVDPSGLFVQEMAQKILSTWSLIEKDLNHPLSDKFYRICEKYDTLFLILGDILKSFAEKPSEIPKELSNPKRLESLVEKFYNQRLSTLRSRLFRMAVYSTLSVFIASGFSLFIIEVPIAKFFYGGFKPLAVFVDIVLPTALMFILVAMVRPPREDNLAKVKEEIRKIVYHQEKEDVYEIRADQKRGLLMKLVVTVLYLLGSFLSLGMVFWVFYIARVPPTSVYIDTLNVAVIVFAALIIRQRAKELVVEEKTSFWEFIIDALSVPMARVGQWLANKWKEYNIVSVFFTILIDTPFMTLVEFVENWSSFIKDKKAQIR